MLKQETSLQKPMPFPSQDPGKGVLWSERMKPRLRRQLSRAVEAQAGRLRCELPPASASQAAVGKRNEHRLSLRHAGVTLPA